MNRRPFLAALLALPLVASLGAAPAFAREHKLVIHIAQGDSATMAQAMTISRYVTESYARYNDTVDIKIVATNSGMNLFRADKTSYADGLRALKQSGAQVDYIACGNTIKGMAAQEGIEPSQIDLLPDVRVVEAGVVELMELQEKGYSYVRP